jgi:nicotinate phosphoribosyltransferase
MVYKLVEVDGRPVAKRSSHKESKAGRKAALRRHKPTGTALEEVVYVVGAAVEEDAHDRQLQVPLLRAGQPAGELPSLEESRRRVREGLVSLPWEGLKLSQGEPAIPTVYVEK